jgi:hypothetical protein
VFLSGSGVLFQQPLDDDWYQATVPSNQFNRTDGTNLTNTYRPLNAASPLGCVQQMQWCNSQYPRYRGCGPLASAHDAFLRAAPLFNLTDNQANSIKFSRPVSSSAVGVRLTWPASILLNSPVSSLDRVLAALGTDSLTSQSSLYNGIQLPLPNDQWQDDVRHWWQTTLASVQASFMLATHFPLGSSAESFRLTPLTEQESRMCRSQVCYILLIVMQLVL